jgi:hypothetical protein
MPYNFGMPDIRVSDVGTKPRPAISAGMVFEGNGQGVAPEINRLSPGRRILLEAAHEKILCCIAVEYAAFIGGIVAGVWKKGVLFQAGCAGPGALHPILSF